MRPEKWSRRIGTYGSPAGLVSYTWVDNSEQEFALDLSKLPNANGSFTDLIPTVNALRFLDVYVQDDTIVDYVILEVKTCHCRDDIVASTAPGYCGTNVFFATPVFADNCDTNLAPVCNPPSGTFFPVGSTTVTCTASDASGNRGRCSFKVTVLDVGGTNPHLSIVRQGPNVVISWPITCNIYALEQTDSLNPVVAWAPAAGTLSSSAGQYHLTVPHNLAKRFYRLRGN